MQLDDFGFFTGVFLGFDENGLPMFDRASAAEALNKFHSTLASDGVNAIDNSFRPTAAGGMNIQFAPGSCVIKGAFGGNKQAKTFTLTSGTVAREVYFVLRNSTPDRDLQLLEDVFTRDDAAGIYDLAIARVLIPAGAASIAQSNITDLRGDASYCGWSGVLAQKLQTPRLIGNAGFDGTKNISLSDIGALKIPTTEYPKQVIPTIGKTLWTGSLSSEISAPVPIPELYNYTLFEVAFSLAATRALIVRAGNYFRGIGGHTTELEARTYHITASLAETASTPSDGSALFSLQRSYAVVHKMSGGHDDYHLATLTLTSIKGLL